MAIQNRRGAYVDLNPAKAVPGELLVVQSGDPNTTDGKAVYVTFASGDIKMLATKSDVETIVAGAVEDIVQDLEDTVDGYADRAETAASNAEDIVAGAEAAIEAKGEEVVDSIPSDYTALTAEVGDIKSALGNNITVGTLTEKRYINKTTGAMSGESNGSKATDFIAVPSGSKLFITNLRGDGSRGTCFYSSNTESSFVSAASLPSSSEIASVVVTVPTNASYVRITGNMSLPDPTVSVYDIVGYIDTVNTALNTKFDKNIGAGNAGKVLMVDNSGNVTPESIPIDAVEYVSPLIASKDDLTLKGYLDTSTGAFVEAPTSSIQRTTDFIELEPYTIYKVEASAISGGEAITGFRTVILYNSDKSFSRKLSSSGYAAIELQTGEKYIRINTTADEVYYMRLYKVATGYTDKTVIKDYVVVPQVHDIDTLPYIYARRPVIGFILDGEYDMNEDMHDIFAAHGVVCGYAVPYNTGFPNNPLTKYIEWQDQGFEMLTHGNYAIPEDTTTPDATAIQNIKDSYARMTANGLYPKGFIGSSGEVAERFIPTIKSLYSWAATVNNHFGSLESNILFGTDKPYYLWRYSMQNSTLDQMKSAVDRSVSQTGLVLFYGHAKSENVDNFTAENLEALLTYIESVGGNITTPSKAVEEYFAVRYDDIYSLIS